MTINEVRKYNFSLTEKEHEILYHASQILYNMEVAGGVQFFNWYCNHNNYCREQMEIDSFEAIGDLLRDIDEFANTKNNKEEDE